MRAPRATLVAVISAVATLTLTSCSSSSNDDTSSPAATNAPEDAAGVAGEPLVRTTTRDFPIEVGDCIVMSAYLHEDTEDLTVDCDEEHTIQIYGITELPDGEYPGRAAVPEMAETFCPSQFEAFVGVDPAASELTSLYFAPTSPQWDEGIRDILCYVLESPGDMVIGSLEGAAR